MEPQMDAFFPLKIFFFGCLILTCIAGVFLFKYSERLFGKDPNMPSETSGARDYTKAQVFICWLVALKLFALMAFMM